MFVEANSTLPNYRQCRDWFNQIRAFVARELMSRDTTVHLPEIKIQFTGRPAFVTEIAGGMENDMGGSAGGTLATIGILFYLTHRRIRPLLWLLALLLALLGATA